MYCICTYFLLGNHCRPTTENELEIAINSFQLTPAAADNMINHCYMNCTKTLKGVPTLVGLS